MSEFVATLTDLFDECGPVTARKMFGCYGLYHEGLMFAIVVDDILYLKTDADSAGEFERAGLEAFAYERAGKLVKMSFYRAPEEILDDRDLATRWAQRAITAARRSRARKTAGHR